MANKPAPPTTVPAKGLNQSAADAIAQGPPPSSTVTPIGPPLKPVPFPDSNLVSPDVQARIGLDTGNVLNVNRPPAYAQYYTGDEWKPGGWTPDRIAVLQSQMVEAGLLNPADYHRGTWDPQSAAAYKEVLAAANASGTEATNQLTLMRSGYTGKAGPKRAPNVVELTSPDDIRSVVNQLSVRNIGRYLTNEEMDPLIQAYQGMQQSYQNQQYAAASPEGTGGTVTQPPSVQAFAEGKVRADHPDEVFTQTAKTRFGSFMNLLTSAGA